MKLWILLVLPATVLSCGTGFDAWFDGRCFKSWNYGRTTHATANQQCGLLNARLPSIKTEEENKMLVNMALSRGVGRGSSFLFWIGLTCNGTDFVWQDGSKATYNNFEDPIECTSEYEGVFFYVGSDSIWYLTIDSPYGIEWIMCEQKYLTSSKCDDYEEVPNSVDDCYVLRTGATNAASAERGCNMMGTHLASIHDKNMNDFMRRTAVSNSFLEGMHIGMAKLDYVHYTWTDKSAVDYTNYGENQPDESKGSCMKMTANTVDGTWATEDCTNSNLRYFCAKKAVVLTDSPQPARCPMSAQYTAGDHIYSPSFPAPGGSHMCDYVISEADFNKKVQLDLVFLEANDCCDSLIIFDTDGTRLKNLSGYMGPTKLSVQAKGNMMTLRWNATSGNNVRGFHAIASNY